MIRYKSMTVRKHKRGVASSTTISQNTASQSVGRSCLLSAGARICVFVFAAIHTFHSISIVQYLLYCKKVKRDVFRI